MHSILFSLTRPDANTPKINVWNSIVESIDQKATTSKQIEILGKGAWLIYGVDGLPELGNLVARAKELEFAFRVLMIEKAEEWAPKA